MSFFISDAMAEGAPVAQQQGDPMVTFIMMGAIFLIFYFLIIRPQSKRAKEHKAMIDALGKGDEVITGGGILGKIITLHDQFVTVEVNQNMQINVQRQSITTVVPKGTIKSIK